MLRSFQVQLRLTAGRIEDCNFFQTFENLQAASDYLNSLPEPISLAQLAGDGQLNFRDGTVFHFQFTRDEAADLEAQCRHHLAFQPADELECLFFEDIRWALDNPGSGQVVELPEATIHLPCGLTRGKFMSILKESPDFQTAIQTTESVFHFLRIIKVDTKEIGLRDAPESVSLVYP